MIPQSWRRNIDLIVLSCVATYGTLFIFLWLLFNLYEEFKHVPCLEHLGICNIAIMAIQLLLYVAPVILFRKAYKRELLYSGGSKKVAVKIGLPFIILHPTIILPFIGLMYNFFQLLFDALLNLKIAVKDLSML